MRLSPVEQSTEMVSPDDELSASQEFTGQANEEEKSEEKLPDDGEVNVVSLKTEKQPSAVKQEDLNEVAERTDDQDDETERSTEPPLQDSIVEHS